MSGVDMADECSEVSPGAHLEVRIKGLVSVQ